MHPPYARHRQDSFTCNVFSLRCMMVCLLVILAACANPSAALQGELQPRPDSASALPGQMALTGTELILDGQIYTPNANIHVSPDAVKCSDMLSPKSVIFSPDGTKIYINALEAFSTLVYSFPDLNRLATIKHRFTKADGELFKNGENTIFGYQYFSKPPAGDPNLFSGKPVEAAFSHNGKYLWAPYYRRDFDRNASSPSAVAIIDTDSNRIVRVMPTGPLPKVVAVAPNNSLVAITHWGDNTVGLIDISGENPADFFYTHHLTVGYKMDTSKVSGNRDSNCGYCLRGTVFTPDSRYLLVGRMGGGGITCFSMEDGKTVGTFNAFSNVPRHIVIDQAGTTLYASSNLEGKVSRVSLPQILDALKTAGGKSIAGPKGESLSVGSGARTIDISPDGRFLYASVNNSSELVQVDLASWKVVKRTGVSPYAVGLAVSPDGKYVVVTSQGKEGQGGGNSVEIFRTVK